jgi:hypothetical protein
MHCVGHDYSSLMIRNLCAVLRQAAVFVILGHGGTAVLLPILHAATLIRPHRAGLF